MRGLSAATLHRLIFALAGSVMVLAGCCVALLLTWPEALPGPVTAAGPPPTDPAVAEADLQLTQLKIDLETSQEWVKALQRRLASQPTPDRVLARAFAERDQAIAQRDQAVKDHSLNPGRADATDDGSLAAHALAAIHEVETIIASTGLDAARLAPPTLPRRTGRELPQGGPLVPLSPDAARLANNVDRLNRLAELLRQMPLSSPVPVVSVSSPFGVRIDPFTGTAAMHEGVDLQSPRGAPVAATGPGLVTFAGWRPEYGEMIEIDHGFGLRTRYAHLSRILVTEGAAVALHQDIGLLGMTGRATGPHLHYEVRVDDRAVNPLHFLKANNYVLPGD